MKTLSTLILTTILLSNPAFAQGDKAGGGGDAKTELRIKNIRDNILGWINSGRAQKLKLPADISYDRYLNGTSKYLGMLKLLSEGQVVVTALNEAQENQKDPEMNTRIKGFSKVCKGFKSKKDFKLHILCNVERFASLSPQEQIPQVHHEYASLGRIEKNEGADSDMFISKQLTDKGEYRMVWLLPVLPETDQETASRCSINIWRFILQEGMHSNKNGLASIKLEDVAGTTINGYTISPLLDINEATFSLSLDFDYSKETTVITLAHNPTGIEEKTRILDSDLKNLANGKTIYAPENMKLLESMKSAKSIKEYEDLKSLLRPELDQTVPGIGMLQAYLMSIPSCEEMIQKY